jgi:hypothetical protein
VNENNQGFEIPELLFAFLEDAVGSQAGLFKLNDRSFRVRHDYNASSSAKQMLLWVCGKNPDVVV